MSKTNLSGKVPSLPRLLWSAFLVGAVLLLGLGNATLYGVGIPLAALVLVLVLPTSRPGWAVHVDPLDMVAVAGLYVCVVALLWLAFRVFTQANTIVATS